MKLPKLICLRCGYSWTPRHDFDPVHCANRKCNSKYWNKTRKNANYNH